MQPRSYTARYKDADGPLLLLGQFLNIKMMIITAENEYIFELNVLSTNLWLLRVHHNSCFRTGGHHENFQNQDSALYCSAHWLIYIILVMLSIVHTGLWLVERVAYLIGMHSAISICMHHAP